MSALVRIHCQSYEKNLGFCLLLGRNSLSYPFLVRMIKQQSVWEGSHFALLIKSEVNTKLLEGRNSIYGWFTQSDTVQIHQLVLFISHQCLMTTHKTVISVVSTFLIPTQPLCTGFPPVPQTFFLYSQACFCLYGKLLLIQSDLALTLPLRVKLSLVPPSPSDLTELSLAFFFVPMAQVQISTNCTGINF